MARLPLLPESVVPAGKGAEAGEAYDWRFCRMLAREYGVIGIPASPFFEPNSAAAAKAGPLARFAFCKKDDTLREARRRLQNPNSNPNPSLKR
jgi:aspartate/methionine/tyrosine aminotransferase